MLDTLLPLFDAGGVRLVLAGHDDGDEARLTPMPGLLAGGRAQPMTALTPKNAIVYPPVVVEG